MRTTHRALVFLLPAVTLSAGCQEFFTIDEACHPKGNFRGKNVMPAAEAAATDRMNCYRRLAGLQRVGTVQELYDAAAGVTNYAQLNPEVYDDFNALDFLAQQVALPGFTGSTVDERLGQANYVRFSSSGEYIQELVGIYDPADDSLVTTIDNGITAHWVEEQWLTPSVIDFAISEVTLDEAWWEQAAEAGQWEARFNITSEDIPTEARFFYAITISEAEPFEHTDEPIYYPKREQTDAAATYAYNPVYKVDEVTGDLDPYAFGAPVFIAYVSPNAGATVTTGTGTGAATSNTSGQLNPYDQKVEHASIHGPEGPIETVVFNPGSAENPENWLGILDQFGFLGSGIYPTEPLQPNTLYTVYYNMTTVDGPYNDFWEFTTSNEAVTTTAAQTAARRDGPSAAPTSFFERGLQIQALPRVRRQR